MTDLDVPTTTRKDWTSDQEVRWCPGCGDYSILAAIQMLLPDLGVRRENTVFVSGIGCAARFPYYMNTYGMHSIHGRAPAIATGLAVTRPDLDVWVITGDGDALSIGGNHLIHALRRNVNLTIMLVQQPDLRLDEGPVLADVRAGKGHQVDAVRLARGAVQPGQPGPRRRGDLRRPHPRHGPQAHDRGVPAGPRSPRGCVRRDLPELQRLQRRRLRGGHRQGEPGRDADPAGARQADPFRGRGERGSCSTAKGGPRSSTSPTSARTPCSCTTRRGRTRGSRSCCRACHAGRTSRRRSACSEPWSARSTATRSTLSWHMPKRGKGPGDLEALLRSGTTWTVE